MIEFFVAAFAGALVSLLVAPWGLYALHWVAYLPMFWVLREDQPRRNLKLALVYGTVAEALIFSWISDTITLFSNIPAVGAWVVTFGFAVLFGLPYTALWTMLHPIRRRFGAAWVWMLPTWLVVVELIAMYVILFPYNQGVSQYRDPRIWQLVSVTGVWGLSWLVLFANCALADVGYARAEGRRFPWVPLVTAAALVAGAYAWGDARFQSVEATLAEAPVVRVWQGQSDKTMTYRLTHPALEAFMYWVDKTRAIPRGSVDLVVWPEGASPYNLNDANAAIYLWDLARERDVEIVVGGGTRERDPDPAMGETGEVRIYNSVYFFGDDDPAKPAEGASLAADFDALLANGCDLDAAHVFTTVEARALAAVPRARVGAAMEPDVSALMVQEMGYTRTDEPGTLDAATIACIGALEARERALRPDGPSDSALHRMTADLPGMLGIRAATSHVRGGLTRVELLERGTDSFWQLDQAGCEDGDCPFVGVRCDRQGCSVYGAAPHYDKMVPLPFGEYLPLARQFPWLATIIQGPGDFRAGTDPVVFEGRLASMATPICYEAILPYVCSRFDHPDLLVNVTNDGWFGNTAASDLHGMLAAIRATELGIPVVRSAYTGVSMVIEPHGRIIAEAPIFTEVSRTVEVRKARVDTFYARWGDWFAWLCALVMGVGWLATRPRPDGSPEGQ